MCYPMRFEPGADLQKGLLKFTEDNGLSAAFVITCVGSVTKATLRMANSTTVSATCMNRYFKALGRTVFSPKLYKFVISACTIFIRESRTSIFPEKEGGGSKVYFR